MNWLRPLGDTGLEVSALGLGTVKLGRDQGVRYSRPFTIPDDRQARNLLATARDIGINLLDTAPAYGASETRLGELLGTERQHWLLCSKVGEEFSGGISQFDFSPEHTRQSITRSLARLQTDVLDIALIHSDGNDLEILRERGTLETLQALKQEGLIRACGISSKTIEGGLAAADCCDVLMLAYSPDQQEQLPVLDSCAQQGTGVLLKKVLASGRGASASGVAEALQLALEHPATSAVVIGTINPGHLASNVDIARSLLG